MPNCVVLTTINEPGHVIEEWLNQGHKLIVVGDIRTPDSYRGLSLIYLDIDEQEKRYPEFSALLPFNHYARKNVGYLHAIKSGYSEIAETDDDNMPLPGWPRLPESAERQKVVAPQYPNVYRLYSKDHIWPRGFPLDLVNGDQQFEIVEDGQADVFVWQGLVNGDPDVDAIYRLTASGYKTEGFAFEKNGAYVLAKGVLCPFNTQNTVWSDSRAFPFLYLPCTVEFRATDIIKSYVAQYCIWAQRGHLAFNGPTAIQERNAHNLIRDFESELSLFTRFYRYMEALAGVSYTGTAHDLYLAYEALATSNLVAQQELDIVEVWLRQIENAQ